MVLGDLVSVKCTRGKGIVGLVGLMFTAGKASLVSSMRTAERVASCTVAILIARLIIN